MGYDRSFGCNLYWPDIKKPSGPTESAGSKWSKPGTPPCSKCAALLHEKAQLSGEVNELLTRNAALRDLLAAVKSILETNTDPCPAHPALAVIQEFEKGER